MYSPHGTWECTWHPAGIEPSESMTCRLSHHTFPLRHHCLFYTTMYLLLTSSVNKVSSQFKISFRSYQKFWIYGIQSKMHQSTLGFGQYFGLSQVNNPKFCDSGHMSNYSNIRGINCTGIIILCLLLKHKTSRKCFWNKSSISFFGQKGFVKAEFNITEKISMNESR